MNLALNAMGSLTESDKPKVRVKKTPNVSISDNAKKSQYLTYMVAKCTQSGKRKKQ